MWSFIGKLFGSTKATEKLVDNLSYGIDKLYYSEQEKSEDKAKALTEARTVLIKWMESTQGSNLARRLIALTITFIWAIQYAASMLMLALVPWFPEVSESLRESALSLQSNGEQSSSAMMLVLGYYFAAPHLGSIVNTAMDKFSGKNKEEKK